MRYSTNLLKLLLLFIAVLPLSLKAKQTIHIKNTDKDVTSLIRSAIQKSTDKDLLIVFDKGIYKFMPEFALERYSNIANHTNGFKKVIFRLEGFAKVEIEGNGSEFIFHGLEAPFQFDNCKNVTIKNLSIDWDIPFTFQALVLSVNEKEGWRDVKPYTKGYSWKLVDGKILFPNIDGYNYEDLGHSFSFDPKTKDVFHGAAGLHTNPTKVEQRPDGVLRFYETMKKYPPVGSVTASKGEKGENRYAPAIQIQNSSNVVIDKVIIHHALGMGFLFERTENIKILNSGIYAKEGTDRFITSTADATHFANCKGDVLIENCRFEGMLDDGTNVHGTYVKVNEKLDDYTVRIALQHDQQKGITFAGLGDEVWFIQQPNPNRGQVNEVTEVNYINETYTDLKFKNKLPANLGVNDILENKTWNPTFTMRGCTISKHRARNMMLKTPKKIIIEGNYLSSDMSSIGFKGETYSWYESGAVEDVIIRNNHFFNCALGAAEHAVLWIAPTLGKTFDQKQIFDRNITFENNFIETFDNRIVWADRLDGLNFKNNTIKQTSGLKQLYPNAYLFDFTNSKNINISGNTYQGKAINFIKVDDESKSSLKSGNNKGF